MSCARRQAPRHGKRIPRIHQVDIHNSYHEYGDESIICEVVLSSDYDTKFIYFLSNHRIINRNTVDPIYHTNEIDLFGEFSGHYRIASNDYNECIKNIIQSNKELHLKNIKLKKYRILNMYMKNVPAEFPKYLSMLNIKITNIGIRDTIDNSFSTLNKINFLEMDLQPILVGFQIVR